jgi:hypothetical protein
MTLKVQEFHGSLFLEGSPYESTQIKKRDCPNPTILVRVICIFVLYKAYDLELNIHEFWVVFSKVALMETNRIGNI